VCTPNRDISEVSVAYDLNAFLFSWFDYLIDQQSGVVCMKQPQAQAQLSRLKSRTSEHEQAEMSSISESDVFAAMLLPIKTVGVQVCTVSSGVSGSSNFNLDTV